MNKVSKQFVIELDGSFHLFSGGALRQIDGLDNLKEDVWIVSDMQETSAKIMTVEVAAKYAEFIVRKKLQESGEFDEAITVVPHWKNARSKSSTDVFVSAFPSRIANFYFDLNKEYEDHLLVFPLYSVLYKFLMAKATKKPIAVIFQHDCFADMIIASKKKVFFASRATAYSQDADQRDELWQIIEEDLKSAEEANRIRVSECFVLNWIDSIPLPKDSETPGRVYHAVETKEVNGADKAYHISFIKALQLLTGAESISPQAAKTFYFAHRWSSLLNIFYLIFVLLLFGGFLFFDLRANQLESEAAILEQNSAGIKVEQPLKVDQQELENTIGFIKALALYQSAPSYKSVINDLSNAISSRMQLEKLKLDYQHTNLLLELSGRIEAPFNLAQKRYAQFLSALEDKGYKVVQNQFSTAIENSQFTLKFQKSVR